MFQVFNMGVGFCVVIAESDAASLIEIVTRHGREALRIGRIVSDPEQKVVIRPRGLIGRGNQFFTV